MSTFDYRVLQANGQIREGVLEARSRNEAFAQLELKGQLLKLDEKQPEARSLVDIFGQSIRRRVSTSELTNFTRQLSALLAAGVPLATALGHLIEESSSDAARTQWQELANLVVEGASLADAMAHFPKTFPRVYIAMIRAGETGGFLDLVLGQIAEFQEREKELKGKVLTALSYPLILASLSIVVVSFLMVYFIPKFQVIFSDFGAALPPLTKAIVSTSDVIRSYGIYVLPFTAVAVLIAHRKMQTPEGRRAWEAFCLKMPIVNSVLSAFAMTRFCRMLGTLVGAGVPLLTSLRVARESLGNQTLVDAVEGAVDGVQKGGGLADSLSSCTELFPKSALHIVAISEQTGRLSEELVRLANTREKDLDNKLRFATTLAEPLLLFVMAAVVGVIVVGMVLPIFTLQDYIK